MMANAVSSSLEETLYSAESRMLVTMRIDKQLFGIPVNFVRDVLKEQKVARIPLAPPEVAGSINLRGRIVTVIDLRCRLKLPPKSTGSKYMLVVVEYAGELYSLMVDAVGEVMSVPVNLIEKSPANINSSWRDVSDGICRLEEELLVMIDIRALLTLP